MCKPENQYDEKLPPVCFLAKAASVWIIAIPVLILGVIADSSLIVLTAQLFFGASMILGLGAVIYVPVARLFGQQVGGMAFGAIAIIMSIVCQAIFFPAITRIHKSHKHSQENLKVQTYVDVSSTKTHTGLTNHIIEV